MIPTLNLAGLIVGLLPRSWYLVGLVVAGVAWAVLLVADGTIAVADWPSQLGAFALALANGTAGVFVARKFAGLVRR